MNIPAQGIILEKKLIKTIYFLLNLIDFVDLSDIIYLQM